MSIKKKLILIGICLVIILAVLSVNVIRKMKTGNSDGAKDTVVKENVMTQAEAYHLLSYLEYDKTKREALPVGIEYADKSMSGWYDTYVNAVWKMGLIEGNVKVSPKEALTYGYCKELMDKLIIDNPKYQEIYKKLTFDFVKADQDMLITNFLELYSALLATAPKDEAPVKEMTLFVLGREVTEDGKDRMVTDLGKYFYNNSKDYENFIKQIDDTTNNRKTGNVTPDVTKKDKLLAKNIVTDNYVDKGIHVLVCGQEIIYISAVTTDNMTIHNVWITKGVDQKVDTFISGIKRSFETKFPLSGPIERVVGDISIENQKVVQISVKPDVIHGKVLLANDKIIEIEGYGKLPLDEGFRIYKIYGDLSLETTNSILVGYEATDFVVSGGKISAALIKEGIKAKNIRVLLKTTDYKDNYHADVKFSVSTDFTVKSKEKEISYKAGDTVTIKPGDKLLSDGRIKVIPKSDKGKIQILSIERSGINPKYRGTIEISEEDQGLVVINDLPLEEYLYAVIPSEMPTYYGLEALKVQAVCARSYAYGHLLANSLNNFGAHVDDSVAYQVYNNIAENEDSILAVKDTYGKVIKYNDKVINAYYFSTSCGHTTGAESVWANGDALPYLTGKLMDTKIDGKEVEAQSKNLKIYQDLSIEENFRTFIKDMDFKTYDSEFDWYRWNTTMSKENIKKVIDNNLSSRYQANPSLILTMTSKAKGGKEAVYESMPVDTIGNIVDISVLKRGTGGIITELLIEGTKNTIKVKTEYNIRVLLAPVFDTMERKDSTKVDNLTLLPSAFFIIDRNEKQGDLTGFTLTGGGYGHGVGMSQNGVKAMTDTGMKYEAIVKYFYKDTEIGFIYE